MPTRPYRNCRLASTRCADQKNHEEDTSKLFDRVHRGYPFITTSWLPIAGTGGVLPSTLVPYNRQMKLVLASMLRPLYSVFTEASQWRGSGRVREKS